VSYGEIRSGDHKLRTFKPSVTACLPGGSCPIKDYECVRQVQAHEYKGIILRKVLVEVTLSGSGASGWPY